MPALHRLNVAEYMTMAALVMRASSYALEGTLLGTLSPPASLQKLSPTTVQHMPRLMMMSRLHLPNQTLSRPLHRTENGNEQRPLLTERFGNSSMNAAIKAWGSLLKDVLFLRSSL